MMVRDSLAMNLAGGVEQVWHGKVRTQTNAVDGIHRGICCGDKWSAPVGRAQAAPVVANLVIVHDRIIVLDLEA